MFLIYSVQSPVNAGDTKSKQSRKPSDHARALEVTIYNNIFRSRDSNLDCMMIYHHTISMPYIQNAKVKE